jgi:hypothetical protein
MRGACHYAEVTPRRALRHSKIVRLLLATSTFLAGRLHLEAAAALAATPAAVIISCAMGKRLLHQGRMFGKGLAWTAS